MKLIALTALIFMCILTRPISADMVRPSLDSDSSARSLVNGLTEGQGTRLPPFDVVGPTEGLAAFDKFATHGPGIRDYSKKWVWAPDRGRALYCGGNHGVPHKFNDVWEYDLSANTWVMQHAPTPDVSPSHTWWGLTYDTERGRLLWMASRAKWPAAGKPPLMAYDFSDGWQPVETRPGIAASPGGALTYLPGRDVVLWYNNNWNGSGLHALDPDTGIWQQWLSRSAVYSGNEDAPSREAIVNHDSRHDVLVAFLDHAVFVYDIEDNEWTRRHKNLIPVRMHDKLAASDYDPVNDVHMIYASNRLFAYHYESDRLEELTGPSTPSLDTAMGYFDRDHEVFVLYDETPRMYVYRYGKRTGSE